MYVMFVEHCDPTHVTEPTNRREGDRGRGGRGGQPSDRLLLLRKRAVSRRPQSTSETRAFITPFGENAVYPGRPIQVDSTVGVHAFKLPLDGAARARTSGELCAGQRELSDARSPSVSAIETLQRLVSDSSLRRHAAAPSPSPASSCPDRSALSPSTSSQLPLLRSAGDRSSFLSPRSHSCHKGKTHTLLEDTHEQPLLHVGWYDSAGTGANTGAVVTAL
jgi:hypothetical protein